MISSIFSKNSIYNTNLKETYNYHNLSNDYDLEEMHLNFMSDIEESYFNILKESIHNQYMGEKYNNVEILHEGFTDIMRSAVDFIKKILNYIVEFFKTALMIFQSYIGDFDKFLTKYKNKLDKLDPDFEIEMYRYSFQKSIPNTEKIDDIVNTYNQDLSDFSNLKVSQISKDKEDFMSDDETNKLRGKVLGISGYVKEEEFLERAKETFRSGMEKPEMVQIDKSKLRELINEYPKMKKELDETTKTRTKIENILNKMKSFFETKPSVLYSGQSKVISYKSLTLADNKLSDGEGKNLAFENDTLKILNLYFDYRFQQTKFLSVILTNAFFEKINALKEAMKTYRTIIRKSLHGKKDKEQ